MNWMKLMGDTELRVFEKMQMGMIAINKSANLYKIKLNLRTDQSDRKFTIREGSCLMPYSVD